MAMTNATDELRALLDERGVAYKETNSGNTTIFVFDYCEQCDDYLHTIAITGACISAYLNYLEPKQAIVATLGRGTCKLEETESYPSECGMVHVLECSNCGRECEHVNGDYEHCPHCLARNELF